MDRTARLGTCPDVGGCSRRGARDPRGDDLADRTRAWAGIIASLKRGASPDAWRLRTVDGFDRHVGRAARPSFTERRTGALDRCGGAHPVRILEGEWRAVQDARL